MKSCYLFSASFPMVAVLVLYFTIYPAHASSLDGEARSTSMLKQERWVYVSCSDLETEQTVPPANGEAGGSVEIYLIIQSRMLEWSINYARLTGAATEVGFFGPAGKGEVGVRQISIARDKIDAGNLERADGSSLRGKALLSASQMEDLIAGHWYLNITTSAHPAGEVRAQLVECERKLPTSYRWLNFWPF